MSQAGLGRDAAPAPRPGLLTAAAATAAEAARTLTPGSEQRQPRAGRRLLPCGGLSRTEQTWTRVGLRRYVRTARVPPLSIGKAAYNQAYRLNTT